MTSNINRKIDALLDAFESSDKGIDLIAQALNEPVREVREVAYWLLTEINEETAKQELRNYLLYARMQCLHTIVGHSERDPSYFTISTNKKALLSNCHSEDYRGYAYATINVWDLQTGELTHALPFPHEHMGTGQDGRIIVGSFQYIISVLKNWEIEHPLQLGVGPEESSKMNSDIGSLTVSQDGSIVACGDFPSLSSGLITVWDLQAEKLIHSLQWQPIRGLSNVSTVMISPDKSLLLSQDKRQHCQDSHRLWNMQTGEMIRVFETSPHWFADAIANRPNGDCIVSGVRENSVKVWDVNSDQVICSFSGCAPTAMTPDGKVLAYCNDANEIVFWDLDINQKICTFPGNTSPIRALCLSSDREWVVSCDADQTIKIYGLRDE
jgi:WD40 repeat protein